MSSSGWATRSTSQDDRPSLRGREVEHEGPLSEFSSSQVDSIVICADCRLKLSNAMCNCSSISGLFGINGDNFERRDIPLMAIQAALIREEPLSWRELWAGSPCSS